MTLLDFFEYATDGAAQTAFVSNAGYLEIIDQQSTNEDSVYYLGDIGGYEHRCAQSFQLSGEKTITAVEIKEGTPVYGSPTGNWTLRIETDDSNKPSGILADVNATVVVTPPGVNTIVKGTFATPFTLSALTKYWLVVQCDNQSEDVKWRLAASELNPYANGSAADSLNGVWIVYVADDLYFKIYVQGEKQLQVYSESTIKTQGTYSLKGIASITDSLNDTLTRTIGNSINLSGQNFILFDIYASRIGANIKIAIHDSGGTTTEKTYTVVQANTWETVSWDISAVSDADKDAIDSIIITIINSDAENIFYLDKMYATTSLIKSINSISIELIKDVNVL